MVAGVVLSTLHVFTVPPVWMIAKAVLPGKDHFDTALRCAAVLLAFMSAVPLKTLEATGNDLLAAAPMLWAIAIAFSAIIPQNDTKKLTVAQAALLSGLLGGIAVACKLSNGPLVVLLPILFVFAPGTWVARSRSLLANATAIGMGFAVTYGYWGYQLWLQFGNPLFPFYDSSWEPVRANLGWHL